MSYAVTFCCLNFNVQRHLLRYSTCAVGVLPYYLEYSKSRNYSDVLSSNMFELTTVECTRQNFPSMTAFAG
jgi:hypothetical protein